MVNSTARRKLMKIDKNKLNKDFLSTTELARLCGVSRFSIINWVKQGKINTLRTVGGKHRIPVAEAIEFLETMHCQSSHETESDLAPDALGHCWEYPRKTNCDNRCKSCLIYGREVDYCFIVVRQFGKGVIHCKGDCLRCEYFGEFFGFYGEDSQGQEQSDENDKNIAIAKRHFLYNFAYGIGRGVHGLKKKGKVK
ncbi:helix-turn-helix domain-containing protein [Planctomycetota bacterium]